MYKVEKSVLGSWVPDDYVISAKVVQKLLHLKYSVRFTMIKKPQRRKQNELFMFSKEKRKNEVDIAI